MILQKNYQCLSKGFSLVEVSLTLGLLGIVLVPLLGLVGVASLNNYKADSSSLGASIAADLFSTVQQADFEQLEKWETTTGHYYYNYEGLSLPADSISEATFTARVSIEDSDLSFDSIPNPYLKTIVVRISTLDGDLATDELAEAVANVDFKSKSLLTYRSLATQLEK